MTQERQSLLLVDGHGDEWWADVSEAECWRVPSPRGCETLFCVDGRWIVLAEDALATLLGQPALGMLISAEDAVRWFAVNGLPIPDSLLEIARRWRLPSSISINSRGTARRRKRRHRRARQAIADGQPGSGNEVDG